MSQSLNKTDVIAILGVIISVVSIVVSIVLVKDGRRFLTEKIESINKLLNKLFSYDFSQSLILLVIGIVFLFILVKSGYIGTEVAIALTCVLVIAFLMLLSIYNNLYRSLGRLNREVKKSSLSINRLTEIEKIELDMIKEKWDVFLEQVSANISLTAIYPVLTMAEPFDINGLNVVVLVPDVLETSVGNLKNRLKDLEPLLENTYSKPYRLAVHTSKDAHFLTMSSKENTK